MNTKAQVILKRWFHHRTRSEYRELSEDLEDEIDVNNKLSLWATVPGLIVDDEESFFLSVEEQQAAMMKAIVPRKDIVKRSSSEDSIGHFCERSGRLARSESFETLETEEESDLAEYDPRSIKYPQRATTIRWADHEGKALETCNQMTYQEPLNVRVVVLMLNPAEKIFEFIQCEFETDERLTVSDLLAQLPFMASMDPLKEQRYSRLYRGERELVNLLAIQDYDIDEGEILVAVAADFNPRHTIAAAAALMLQKDLLRAVQKAKLSGRALQKLVSSSELALLDQEESPLLIKEDREKEMDRTSLLINISDDNPLGVASSLSSGGCWDGEDSTDCKDMLSVEVQNLHDEDFQVFQEALDTDPYSPVALGRMEKLPKHFFSEDLDVFEPKFGPGGETFTDNWGEVSSDEGSLDEIDPEPMNDSPHDVNTSTNSFLVLQKQYQNDIAFFSDLSDNSDDEDDDEQGLQNTSMDSFVYGFMGEPPASHKASASRGVSLDDCDYGDDIVIESDYSDDSDTMLSCNEMEPIPDMALVHPTQGLDYNKTVDFCRIANVDSLDDKTPQCRKKAGESDLLNSQEEYDLEKIPDIAEFAEGTAATSDFRSLNPEECYLPLREKEAQGASACFMSAAVLFAAMDKLSSHNQEGQTQIPRDFFLEEVEV